MDDVVEATGFGFYSDVVTPVMFWIRFSIVWRSMLLVRITVMVWMEMSGLRLFDEVGNLGD